MRKKEREEKKENISLQLEKSTLFLSPSYKRTKNQKTRLSLFIPAKFQKERKKFREREREEREKKVQKERNSDRERERQENWFECQ